MKVPITSHKQKNTWGRLDVHTSAWDLKRQYKVRNFGLKAEIRWSLKRRGRSTGLSSEERDLLVTQADLSAPRVCSPAVALLPKNGPRNRRKICMTSLGLYSYYTQPSLSKNKNMHYIFIYLRVLRCLSSASIYGTTPRIALLYPWNVPYYAEC